ncbi:hypothetical protein [Streptomyces sp. V4I2]|uniref:hypothetical protein n=1 Tax=Streptomyces sp. V4I2 TaxID=3042280 RepID=UPI002788A00D|nr:hypothetical protein [Streptomyces sp. V4I2]MDQ1042022.1 hypothetical protein [Streptomyces sp. V4I2]
MPHSSCRRPPAKSTTCWCRRHPHGTVFSSGAAAEGFGHVGRRDPYPCFHELPFTVRLFTIT